MECTQPKYPYRTHAKIPTDGVRIKDGEDPSIRSEADSSTTASPKDCKVLSKDGFIYILDQEEFVKWSKRTWIAGEAPRARWSRSEQPLPIKESLSMPSSLLIPCRIFKPSDRDTLMDIYNIHDKLGEGSHGTVNRVRTRDGLRFSAFKVCKKPNPNDKFYAESVVRIQREVLMQKRLDHPNIAKLEAVYEDEENIYLVAELCEGGELFYKIATQKQFEVEDVASVVEQVLYAIKGAQSHLIMHRDIKPENILYVEKDALPDGQVKVIDWGFACTLPPNTDPDERVVENTKTTTLGTPYYCAPEILSSLYSHKADHWSIGVLAFVLLTGSPPFFGRTVKEILSSVTSDRPVPWGAMKKKIQKLRLRSNRTIQTIEDFVRGLINRNPDERFTLSEALRHPFIELYGKKAKIKFQPSTAHQCLQRMIRFSNISHLSRLARWMSFHLGLYQLNDSSQYHAFEEYRITNKHGVQDSTLYELFCYLDRKRDGTLPHYHVFQILNQLIGGTMEIEKLRIAFQSLDLTGNGCADYSEFLTAMIDPEQTKINTRKVFKMMDVDADGYLSKEDLLQITLYNPAHMRSSGASKENVYQPRAGPSKLAEDTIAEASLRLAHLPDSRYPADMLFDESLGITLRGFESLVLMDTYQPFH